MSDAEIKTMLRRQILLEEQANFSRAMFLFLFFFFRFTKFDRFRYKEVHKKALSPYLAALRGVVLDTFYMFLVIIGIVILSKVLEIALFFLLKRFDLVRQVKHYQTHRDLKGELSVPHCIKYPSNESIIRHVGPLHMSNEMIVTFGSNIHEGKSIQWIK